MSKSTSWKRPRPSIPMASIHIRSRSVLWARDRHVTLLWYITWFILKENRFITWHCYDFVTWFTPILRLPLTWPQYQTLASLVWCYIILCWFVSYLDFSIMWLWFRTLASPVLCYIIYVECCWPLQLVIDIICMSLICLCNIKLKLDRIIKSD